jgi:3-oxoacyl-[acyl-carrier-protein] synthase-3
VTGRLPAITGIGAAHGKNAVTNEELARKLFPPKSPDESPGRSVKLMQRLMRPIGIESRYWVDRDLIDMPTTGTAIHSAIQLRGLQIVTSDLAVEAVLQAADMAGVEKSSITSVTVGSGTQDFRGVAVAALVQDKLGLPTTTRTYDVYAACPGWVHALANTFNDLYSPIGAGGPQAVVGAETLSPILSEQEQLLYPLFGDAAGATIVEMVEPDPGAPTGMAFAFGTDGSYARNLYMPGGGTVHPTSHATIDQDLHTLKMDGGLVKDLAVKHMAALTQAALAKAGVSIDDVALLVPHQANLEIMQATADAAGIPYERMAVSIDHYGNTSAASIPTALREAWEQGRVKRNDVVAFATFGAGLNFGAAVIPMVGLPAR